MISPAIYGGFPMIFHPPPSSEKSSGFRTKAWQLFFRSSGRWFHPLKQHKLIFDIVDGRNPYNPPIQPRQSGARTFHSWDFYGNIIRY